MMFWIHQAALHQQAHHFHERTRAVMEEREAVMEEHLVKKLDQFNSRFRFVPAVHHLVGGLLEARVGSTHATLGCDLSPPSMPAPKCFFAAAENVHVC